MTESGTTVQSCQIAGNVVSLWKEDVPIREELEYSVGLSSRVAMIRANIVRVLPRPKNEGVRLQFTKRGARNVPIESAMMAPRPRRGGSACGDLVTAK